MMTRVNPDMETDKTFMQAAIAEAEIARSKDEVPIGAILVKDDQLVYADHNRTNQTGDPRAHAEKLILEEIHKYQIIKDPLNIELSVKEIESIKKSSEK